jgi:acyl carrier protein
MKTLDFVTQIISDELSVDASIVTAHAQILDKVCVDSLDAVELVMRFEEEFEVEIVDEEAEQLVTVGEVISYLEDKVGTRVNPPNGVDSRERVLSSIARRRGQLRFRRRLLEIYNQQCAITRYSGVEALEAAHISLFEANILTNQWLVVTCRHPYFV